MVAAYASAQDKDKDDGDGEEGGGGGGYGSGGPYWWESIILFMNAIFQQKFFIFRSIIMTK